MRTCVRVERRHHPARRPRLVLRVGRAARRPAAARPAGHRRRRGRARRQLRGQARAACARPWAARRPGGCARRPSSSRRGCRPTRRRARPCSRSSPTRRRWSRACRSTRPSSTSRGLRRIAGHADRDRHPAAPRGARAGRAAHHGRRGADQVPGQGRQRRGQARRPAGRAARRRARVPAPAARRAAVGRRPATAAKLHDRGITTVGEVAAHRRAGARRDRSAAPSGRQLHALAHNRDPRPVQVGVRRRSIGSQHALGRRRRSPEELDAVLVGIVDRVARRLRAAHRVCRTVVLRLRFDDFSRATRSHTLPQATAADRAHPRHGARAARDGHADDRAPGPDAARHRPDQPRATTTRSSSSLAFERRHATRRGARQRARPLRHAAITRAVLLGRDHGQSVPLLPD